MDFSDVIILFKDQIGAVFGVGGATTGGFAWWSVKQNKEAIDSMAKRFREIDKEFEDHRIDIAKHYATNESVEKIIIRVEAKLDKIFDKLDTKADK